MAWTCYAPFFSQFTNALELSYACFFHEVPRKSVSSLLELLEQSYFCVTIGINSLIKYSFWDSSFWQELWISGSQWRSKKICYHWQRPMSCSHYCVYSLLCKQICVIRTRGGSLNCQCPCQIVHSGHWGISFAIRKIWSKLNHIFYSFIQINSEFNKAIAEDSDCTMRKNGKVYNTLDYDVMSFTLLKLVGFLVQVIHKCSKNLSDAIQSIAKKHFSHFEFRVMPFTDHSVLSFNFDFSVNYWGTRLLFGMNGFKMHFTEVTWIYLIWNNEQRPLRILFTEKEDINDQNKRRLSLKFLMKDHLIIVQMFKLTEAAFAHVLISFFAVQVNSDFL